MCRWGKGGLGTGTGDGGGGWNGGLPGQATNLNGRLQGGAHSGGCLCNRWQLEVNRINKDAVMAARRRLSSFREMISRTLIIEWKLKVTRK